MCLFFLCLISVSLAYNNNQIVALNKERIHELKTLSHLKTSIENENILVNDKMKNKDNKNNLISHIKKKLRVSKPDAPLIQFQVKQKSNNNVYTLNNRLDNKNKKDEADKVIDNLNRHNSTYKMKFAEKKGLSSIASSNLQKNTASNENNITHTHNNRNQFSTSNSNNEELKEKLQVKEESLQRTQAKQLSNIPIRNELQDQEMNSIEEEEIIEANCFFKMPIGNSTYLYDLSPIKQLEENIRDNSKLSINLCRNAQVKSCQNDVNFSNKTGLLQDNDCNIYSGSYTNEKQWYKRGKCINHI